MIRSSKSNFTYGVTHAYEKVAFFAQSFYVIAYKLDILTKL